MPMHIPPRSNLSDLLAAERTFLAWIRTGLALMGFGFVVAKFDLFLQQLQFVQHASAAPTYGLSLWFGTALIVAGVIIFVLSAWHHLRLVQELNREGRVPSRPSTQAVPISLFLALVGLAMVIYLIFVHAHVHVLAPIFGSSHFSAYPTLREAPSLRGFVLLVWPGRPIPIAELLVFGFVLGLSHEESLFGGCILLLLAQTIGTITP